MLLLSLAGLGVSCLPAQADLCTTQARLPSATRDTLAAATLELARTVLASDAAKLRGLTVAEYAGNADATTFLVRSTAEKAGGGTPTVTGAYLLDATSRKAGDPSEADFACALSGSGSEVDFSVAALPPGIYAFTMAEVNGPRPWLLSFLLREEGSAWKMAGFYPHARVAAAHDGLWYWSSARDHAKAGQKWLAWTYFGEADQLLRPANFATSTNLDALRTEQRNAAPGELSEGVSAQTPLVVIANGAKTGSGAPTSGGTKASGGTVGQEFHLTALTAEGSEDGKRLNLMLHVQGEPVTDTAATRARNLAAASALLTAHRELREGYAAVWVFNEAPGQNPFVTQHPIAEIP